MTNQPVLYRPRTDSVLAGVCAGLARRYRIDPTIVRVLMVALCLAGGFGLALYLAGIVTIPRDASKDAPVRRLLPFTRTWPTPALWLATSAVILVMIGGIGGWEGVFVIPVAVIVVLVVYSARSRHKGTTPRTFTPEPTPFERSADAWQLRVDAHRQGLAVPSAAIISPPPETPPLPVPAKAPRGHGWAIALSLMAVGIGVLAILAFSGVPVLASAYVAVVAFSLGVGLLASVRRGRPRGMTALAIIACVATGVAFAVPGSVRLTSTQTVSTDGRAWQVPAIGQESVTFNDVDAVPATIDAGFGNFTYDFSGLAVTRDVSTTITVFTGAATVKLPPNQNVQVDYQVRAGAVTWRMPGSAESQTRGGPGLSDTLRSGSNAGSHLLHITVDVGAGNLEIQS